MSDLKECLVKLSVSDILTAQEDIAGHLFLPVVDDNFLHGEFLKILRSEQEVNTFKSLELQGLLANVLELWPENIFLRLCSLANGLDK